MVEWWWLFQARLVAYVLSVSCLCLVCVLAMSLSMSLSIRFVYVFYMCLSIPISVPCLCLCLSLCLCLCFVCVLSMPSLSLVNASQMIILLLGNRPYQIPRQPSSGVRMNFKCHSLGSSSSLLMYFWCTVDSRQQHCGIKHEHTGSANSSSSRQVHICP